MQMETGDGPMTCGDFAYGEDDIDVEIADAADLIDSYCWQVPSTQTERPQTNVQTELVDTFLAVCRNKLSLSCSEECECGIAKEWLLDSGASLHFTGDITDFVNYTPMENGIEVLTTNSSTQVKGQGTVILLLSTGGAVRIHPVFYVPDLTVKLLSLGTFLRNGHQCTGTSHSIQVMKNLRPFLTFRPRSEGDSIYVIRSLAGNEAELHSAITTIYKVDYEIIHQRMAHPSKDVISKAWKHLKDFPQIEIPTEEHICPGCAQGKMTNRPFYASTRRATRPFELIHSDLKSFPIESYHRYKYVIVFFDDYTSHAWTVNMRTKDAALTATSHFLAMVETKFGSRVTQWMSDAGGEYKSKSFDKMLKDRGIKILQSIPYTHQQNRRAERIIRTLMEKAESMRHLACLPQSWWEFSVEHATHVYNRTPMSRLNWQTPFTLLWREKPTIDHLRVFGCGAYVFIPAETRANKLAPKSELMTYLGNAPGANGFVFMRGPNNMLYYATHCIFDESLFPKCPKQAKTPSVRLQENAPPQHYHTDDPPVEEELLPKKRVPRSHH